MEPFTMSLGMMDFQGGLAGSRGRHLTPYWYGEDREIHIPGVGKARLPKGLIRPFFKPSPERGKTRVLSSTSAFFEAFKAFQGGRYLEALVYLQGGDESPEAVALTGFIMLLQGKRRAAIPFLEMALVEEEGSLGDSCIKGGIMPYLSFSFFPGARAGVTLSQGGVRFLLAHLYREMEAYEPSSELLEELVLGSEDPFLLLELVELIFGSGEYDQVVEVLHDVENLSPIHTLLLFYLTRSLEVLEVPYLALVAYNKALKRKKDRDPGLLKVIRYHRALLYQKMGRRRRYRQELEILMDEDPHYMDVGKRMLEMP